jgi:hypothetical protein
MKYFYIWELMLEMMRRDISGENICFDILGRACAYSEVFEPAFPEYEKDRIYAVVNPYDRFDGIFAEWLGSRKPVLFRHYQEYMMESDTEYRHWEDGECAKEFDGGGVSQFNGALSDIILHFLADIDLKSGMTVKEYYIKFIKNEMADGIFGDGEVFKLFGSEEKRCIAHEVLNLYISGNYTACAEKVLKKVFPYSSVSVRDDNKEIIFYLREKRGGESEKKAEFIKKLFVPVNAAVAVHWEYTYGIVSEPDSIALEEFVI